MQSGFGSGVIKMCIREWTEKKNNVFHTLIKVDKIGCEVGYVIISWGVAI